MKTWDEALTEAETTLATPVADGFPLPGSLFSGLGPISEEHAERAYNVAQLIEERIAATEALKGETQEDLDWTRDRMQSLLPAAGSPVYLDITA